MQLRAFELANTGEDLHQDRLIGTRSVEFNLSPVEIKAHLLLEWHAEALPPAPWEERR